MEDDFIKNKQMELLLKGIIELDKTTTHECIEHKVCDTCPYVKICNQIIDLRNLTYEIKSL